MLYQHLVRQGLRGFWTCKNSKSNQITFKSHFQGKTPHDLESVGVGRILEFWALSTRTPPPPPKKKGLKFFMINRKTQPFFMKIILKKKIIFLDSKVPFVSLLCHPRFLKTAYENAFFTR
jgi:hypothetical protein